MPNRSNRRAYASRAQERTMCLAFAAAYMAQSKLDLAAGRADWAKHALAKRRQYQERLAAMRKESN